MLRRVESGAPESEGRAAAPAPEIAIVVPTFNEADNVARIARRLGDCLGGRRYELVFVDDDSPDGTADLVRRLGAADGRIRCLQRIGRRGLATAVTEGLLATSAPFAAVIDADLQHDETRLPEMFDRLAAGADLVVASRYLAEGDTGDWQGRRPRLSRIATWLTSRLIGTGVTDPMSGFFALRTEAFHLRAARLSGTGYKILLDILTTEGPALRVEEVPYRFGLRAAGESKLDSRVMLDFVELLIAKTLGRVVPTKFVMFSIVGAGGVVVHMATLWLVHRGLGLAFAPAQATATLVAMVTNFFVNNLFTYHDRRLVGWRLIPGLLSFCLISAVGAIANVGVAVYLFRASLTGWALSAAAGIVVGAAWNFALTARYTWTR